MYFYENNPILIAQFSCIVMSLLSVVGVIIVYLLGKGWRFFIANQYVIFLCIHIQYDLIYINNCTIPQVLQFYYSQHLSSNSPILQKQYDYQTTITPFIFYDDDNSKGNDYCQFKSNTETNNSQYCIDETSCKLQGYFINSSFLASTLISLYSCYIIKQTLNPNLKFRQNKKQIYWIHFAIGIFTFAICLPMLIGAEFQHYGTSWNNQLIFYICNIKVRSHNKLTLSLFWLQSTITSILIIVGIIFHCSVRKLKSKIRINFTDEFDSCTSLNLYVLPITLLALWTFNMIQKLIDYQTEWIRQWGQLLQVLWFIPQLLLALQGFNYASLFFYAFHQQLVPNLPKSLQSTYMFFARISIYNFIFGKIKNSQIPKDSLLYDVDSSKESTIISYLNLLYFILYIKR